MRRVLLALVLASSVLLPVVPRNASAASRVAGVDVSIWQGVVDWNAVAATSTRFVIMRAVKGRHYVDPTYATNLAGATAAGLVVGAYHRATPSAAAGDARAEANHFLSVARNAAGDLIPALDIEETGGLNPEDLTGWVKTWVTRVRHVLGVRPMLYASPYFWRTKMGDSTWFATHGYPLWIANWNVRSPDVPAGDWNGQGWTFWQWTSTGSVNGISTAVDRDRYDGTDLIGARIASVTITAPIGGTVTGTKINCGPATSRCDRLASPGDELTLEAVPDADSVFLGWTGACAPAGTTPVCTVTALGDIAVSAVFGYTLDVGTTGTGGGTVVSDPAGLDCAPTCAAVFPAGSDVTLAAAADSASAFVSWGGACAGSGLQCTVTLDGPSVVTARFDATTTLGEEDPGTAFGWGRSRDPIAYGGAYRWERRADASISFAIHGSAVTLLTLGGPAMGKARVRVDGAVVGRLDGYAPSLRSGVEHRFTQLGSGDHVLTVTALGTKRAKATGTRVAVDALRFGGALQANPKPTAAAWHGATHPAATGGTYVVSGAAGAIASLAFVGTGVTLQTAVGPSMGRAELWVDGVLARTISLRGSALEFGVTRTVTGLEDAAHTLRIVVLGGDLVVDGWVVR